MNKSKELFSSQSFKKNNCNLILHSQIRLKNHLKLTDSSGGVCVWAQTAGISIADSDKVQLIH